MFRSLSGTDKAAASVILRLFKLIFSSLSMFADNETVLQPHLATIITSSMKYPIFRMIETYLIWRRFSSEVKESLNYFALLRSLFRSMSGGKFDLLMKELLPLLPSM